MRILHTELRSIYTPILASAAVAIIAVSGDSLWIDEGLSAMKATAPTVQEAWQRLASESSTNLHMLLYMFCLWVWEKFFGASEWALRAMNIPFFVMGVTALWLGVQQRLRVPVLLACLCSPFLWFYLDEARPYTMLFAFSAVVTSCLIYWRDHQHDARFPFLAWAWTLSLALSALIWTHVVGLVFEVAAAVFLFAAGGPLVMRQIATKALLPVLVAALFNVVLFAYVRWTLAEGVTVPSIGKTTLINLLFWVYEFMGFQGFGPNRNDLRSISLTVLQPNLLSFMALSGSWLLFAACGLKKLSGTDFRTLLLTGLTLVVLPLLLFMLIGYLQGTRFLTRYAAASYPPFAVLVAIIASAAWRTSRPGRFSCLLLAGLLSISSLQLRFNPKHDRDDYRTAAHLALQYATRGATVLWAADINSGEYYGINFQTTSTASQQRPFTAGRNLAAWQKNFPDILFLSKPDIYDESGKMAAHARKLGYVESLGPRSFTIFRSPSWREN